MRRPLAALLTLGIAGLAAGPLYAQFRGRGPEADAARHGWLSSLEAGKSQAHQSGKPLMVVLRCVP